MSEMEKVIIKPSVGKFIELLEKFNKNMPLRINDADTGWEISIIHYNIIDEKLFLSGKYIEMGEDNGS